MAGRTRSTATDNGPFLVKEPLLVTDAESNEFQVNRETVALCRCGGSTNKPFCDGAHSKLGFRAAERAIEREDRGRDLSTPARTPDSYGALAS